MSVMQRHQVSKYEIYRRSGSIFKRICVNMLPKTWQELSDALTLESKSIGFLNKISSVKLQEDTIDIQGDSEIGSNILWTFYTNKNKAKTSFSSVFYLTPEMLVEA
jgi:hypothetical protein